MVRQVRENQTANSVGTLKYTVDQKCLCLTVVLYESPAGAMLSHMLHSLLLLGAHTMQPLLHQLLGLLPHLNDLNRLLPATAMLEEQELEGSSAGRSHSHL